MQHILRNSILLGIALAVALAFLILGPMSNGSICFFPNCQKTGELARHVIDVRKADEYALGHVQGALNIPHDELVAHVLEYFPDKSTPLTVYCRNGNRSTIATRALEQMGYTDLQNLGSIENAAKRLNKPIVH